MRYHFKVIFGSILLISLVSCGGNKGSSYSPLNSEQKANFVNTLESTGRTLDAAGRAKSRNLDEAFALNAVQVDKMQTEMAAKLVQKQCLIQYSENPNGTNSSGGLNPGSSSSGATKAINLDISLSGDNCPAQLDFHLAYRGSSTKYNGILGSLKAHGKYSVKDEDYKKLNDITGFNFSGGGDIRAENDGERKAKVITHFDVSGELLSQKHGAGNFQISSKGTIRVTEEGGEGDIDNVILVKFPSYTAELKQIKRFERANGKTYVNSTYLLNGESISGQEFQNYVGKFGGKYSTHGLMKAFGN